MPLSESKRVSSHRSPRDTDIRGTSIGSIFRDYGEDYIKQHNPYREQINLIRSIRICKTPTLGGKVIRCKSCQHDHYIYFSCGHSQCPLCQSIKREQWIDKLREKLYDVPHVHMIFTLPHQLNKLAKKNASKIYSLLMRSSYQTVKELSTKNENIGGLPGMISVFHSFGSDMKYHLHTHSLVTFGGYDEKTKEWRKPKRKDKIARYRQINSTYKRCFMEGLEVLYNKGEIDYELSYSEVLEIIGEKQWVVHSTKPTMDLEVVERYLGRYINRVAISPSRVGYSKEDQSVRILYNDYKNQIEGQAAPKEIRTLHPLTFIVQFMQHVLPPYFQKSRSYGLYSTATRKRLEELLPASISKNGHMIRTVFEILTQLLKDKPFECEKCKSTEYELLLIKPDKDWVRRFTNIPTLRAPPVKSEISSENLF